MKNSRTTNVADYSRIYYVGVALYRNWGVFFRGFARGKRKIKSLGLVVARYNV